MPGSFSFPPAGFLQPTRDTIDALSQSYRTPGVVPGPVPPGQVAELGTGDDSSTALYPVADEFIKAISFQCVSEEHPFGRQYVVGVTTDAGDKYPLPEPLFSTAGSGTAWVPGAAAPFGQPLGVAGTASGISQAMRLKKTNFLVRADQLMGGEMKSDEILQAEV